MIAPLEVRVLGKLRLQRGSNALSVFPTRRVEELLAFLVVNQNVQHSREKLVDILWPDVPLSNGRASLSTTLWRLRNSLIEISLPAENYLQTGRDWVSFGTKEPIDLDVARFQQHICTADEAADSTVREKSYSAAAESYTGVFCDGIYAEWCLIEREKLERDYLRSLGQLMACSLIRNDFDNAIVIGQQILDRDPLREEVHRALMHCYWNSGQRSKGIRQFQMCAHALQSELHILPMADTINLYRQMIGEVFQESMPSDATHGDGDASIWEAYTAFQTAADNLLLVLDDSSMIPQHTGQTI